MGNFNQAESVKLICCADSMWYHKICLKQMAFDLHDDFDCPNCDDNEIFRKNMLENGIFIPSSDYMPSKSNDIGTPQPKRKRVHKNWVLEHTYENKKNAMDAIESEKCWGYHYDNKSDAGKKITYRCKLVKARGQQCAAAVHLLFDATNPSVHLYRADSPHTHTMMKFAKIILLIKFRVM